MEHAIKKKEAELKMLELQAKEQRLRQELEMNKGMIFHTFYVCDSHTFLYAYSDRFSLF